MVKRSLFIIFLVLITSCYGQDLTESQDIRILGYLNEGEGIGPEYPYSLEEIELNIKNSIPLSGGALAQAYILPLPLIGSLRIDDKTYLFIYHAGSITYLIDYQEMEKTVFYNKEFYEKEFADW